MKFWRREGIGAASSGTDGGRPTSVEIFAMQAHPDGTVHSAVIEALSNFASRWPSREGLQLRPTGGV